jgi:molybdopterin molybdotransferase
VVVANRNRISVDEAVKLVARHVRPVRPKFLPLARAVGRRTADPVLARRPVPAVPLAAENGFGVWAKEIEELSETACAFVVPRSAPVIIREAPLPEEVNAVLPVEATTLKRGQRLLQRAVKPGDGVILPGSLLQPGDEILAAGKNITLLAAHMAELAGVNEVHVRMPLIDVVFNSTQNPSPNDSFIRIVADEVSRRGGVLGSVQVAGGDVALLKDALALSSADMVYVIGGTRDGASGTTIQALESVGQMIFRGVRMEPGGTTSLALVDGRPVLALPCCLPDLLAANAILTRHVSLVAAGRPTHPADTREARLAAGVPASGGHARVYFGCLEDSVFEILETPHSLSPGFSRVNAMVVAPAGARARASGGKIAVLKVRGTGF